MRRGSSIKKMTKRLKAVFLATVVAVAGITAYAALTGPVEAYADTQRTGRVDDGVTNLRIRSSTDTSSTANVITKVNGGFEFDILDTVQTSDTYAWYYVGFYFNGAYTYGYVTSEFVTVDPGVDYEPDADFEAYMEAQGFPASYREGLRELHAQYPNWIFVADHTGKDWQEVVDNENVLGRSLIYNWADSSWKSTADGAYNWDTGEWYELDSGGWVQASSELVQYALDPRNFLNTTNVFMFESLSYNSGIQNEDGVRNVISGTFMQDSGHDLSYDGGWYQYPSALMLAGRTSGVSPYHLATRIIQEQGGNGQGSSISGTVGGYEGYYNYFNQGAYKTASASAVVNGLIYASRTDSATMRPWNTRMKSIIGGSISLGSGYINRGQDTLYYEKFDIDAYWHQYMTNILAPRSESQTASKAYSSETKRNTAFLFTVPVYNNMPEQACPLPEGDGSPNNTLQDLYVDGHGLTPTFNKYTQEYDLIVENSVAGVTVSASPADGNAGVDGTGYYDLAVGLNTVYIYVTAPNGDVRTYTIHIVREEDGSSGGDTTEAGYQSGYVMDAHTGRMSGIGVGSLAADVLNGITFTGGAYGNVYAADGSENTGIIKTGDRLVIYRPDGSELASFQVVIYGDLNGDGRINAYDLIIIRSYMLNIMPLEGAYVEAADTNRGNDGVNAYDLIVLRSHLLNITYIKQ